MAATLARLPERGRGVPDFPRPGLREVLFGDYRIVYRVDSRRIAILTVRHLRRRFDPEELG